MLGDAIDADTAERWGMIWKAVDDTALMTETEAMATRLAKSPAGAISAIKTMFVAAALATAGAIIGFAFFLRAHVFWLYVISALGSWIVVQWTLIVVMRVLGNYYYQHRSALRWHRECPRWGVAWRL
jgi:hypothetical protein